MNTDLTADNLRRLDAYNIIDALAAGDRDTTLGILALHNEDPEGFYRLTLSLAQTAATMVKVLPAARDLLATFRAHDLSGEGES